MEQHLGRHDYLVGETATIADLALYAYTHVAEEGGFNLRNYPALMYRIFSYNQLK